MSAKKQQSQKSCDAHRKAKAKLSQRATISAATTRSRATFCTRSDLQKAALCEARSNRFFLFAVEKKEQSGKER